MNHDYDVARETGTLARDPHEMEQTMDEAKAFHNGFLLGASMYAATVGHSTLKEDNEVLRALMESQGLKTIEAFERITGRSL